MIDILRALLCLDGGIAVAAVAEAAGVSGRTVLRALPALEAAGAVEVARGGGRGNATLVTVNRDKLAKLATLSAFRTDDPADRTPGREYTRIAPEKLAETKAQRAKDYERRFGCLPSWATSGTL